MAVLTIDEQIEWLENTKKIYAEYDDTLADEVLSAAIDAIKRLKPGHWIGQRKIGLWGWEDYYISLENGCLPDNGHCSECGEEMEMGDRGKYCPNCGRRMKSGVEE